MGVLCPRTIFPARDDLGAEYLYDIEMLPTVRWLSKEAQPTIIYKIRRCTPGNKDIS
jgi:hypothetical protein